MSGLLDQQQALQDEAAAVLADLDLRRLLQEVGRPVQVGSVALGLMVARDIDVTVLCPVLETAAIFTALSPLAGHPRIRELRFRDDTGDWNVDPNYPDGVYWGPRYRSEAGKTGTSTSGSSTRTAASSTSSTWSRCRRS